MPNMVTVREDEIEITVCSCENCGCNNAIEGGLNGCPECLPFATSLFTFRMKENNTPVPDWLAQEFTELASPVRAG